MRRSGGPAIEELAKEGDSGAVKFRVSMYLCISYLYIWCPFSAIFIIGLTFALDQHKDCIALDQKLKVNYL